MKDVKGWVRFTSLKKRSQGKDFGEERLCTKMFLDGKPTDTVPFAPIGLFVEPSFFLLFT